MKPFIPELTKLPKRSVLTYTTHGNPNGAMTKLAINALYGTAYGTKFKVFKPKKKDMKIGGLSAYWPDAHKQPKNKWTGIWNLEIPSFVKPKDLIQKDLQRIVKIGTLPDGTYAQIMHIGPYSTEGPTVQKLHAFIQTKNMKIAGPHEEVYLTKPGPMAKTLIRYQVDKSKR